MKRIITKSDSSQPVVETAVYLFDDWFDPIEAGVRDRVRGFIQAMIEGELDETLKRPRYAPRPPCAQGAVCGRHRQGCRQPGLAEGKERLGRLERPLARRGADCAADPRRHRGSRPARSKSH